MINLLAATIADIPTIRRMAEAIWLAHYPSIIGMEQVEYMLAKMYSAERLEQQMSDGATFFLVHNQAETIGFIAVQPGETEQEAFIDKFYLSTTVQAKGTGTAAFEQLKRAMPQVTTYRLQVNRQNYKSINFYFKNGFVIERCLDVEIGDGYAMNDFVMVRR